MANLGRRNVLKAMSAAGISAAIPLGLHASNKHTTSGSSLAVYVDVKQPEYKGGALNEMVNLSDKPLVLNGAQPLSYETSAGDVTTVYLNTPTEYYTLQPGERLPIYAKAVMTNSPEIFQAQSVWQKPALAVV